MLQRRFTFPKLTLEFDLCKVSLGCRGLLWGSEMEPREPLGSDKCQGGATVPEAW